MKKGPSLRLYVAGTSPNTTRAIENLRLACEAAGHPNYPVSVVDVVREPQRALDDGILVAPTLVRVGFRAERRIIGDLRDRDAVMALLALPEAAG
jgi:circadian clock protein KaiB